MKLQLWLANSFACCGAPSSNVQISFIDRQIYFADSKARPAAPSSGHVASCVSLEKAYLAHPYERWRHAAHNFGLMLQEADVAAVSWQVRLAVLKDAKLDVSKVPAK